MAPRKKNRLLMIAAICGALLTIGLFSEKVYGYYKEHCLKPYVENILEDRLKTINRNVLTMLDFQERTAKRDSVAREDWNAAVKAVDRLLKQGE